MDDLAGQLCLGFDLGAPLGIQPAARGAMGVVSRLQTEREGRQVAFAVKEVFWGRTTDVDVSLEVGFRDRCAGVGVPSPRPVRSTSGRYWLDLRDGDLSRHFRCYTWVDGRTGSADEGLPDVVATWLARMHALPDQPDGGPVPDWYLHAATDWETLLGRGAAAGAPWAARLSELLHHLNRVQQFVDSAAASQPVWAHRDLGGANLLHTPSGPLLVDWDNCGPLPPERELATVLLEVPPTRRPSFYASYQRAGGPARITDRSAFATVAAIHLNFLAGQAALLLDPAHHEHHPFAGRAVNDMLRTFRTVADYEHLADQFRSSHG